MLAVVWRVWHPTWDVDAFVAEFRLKRALVGRRGDLLLPGRRRRACGFNLSIDRNDDGVPHAIAALRKFLRRHRRAFLRLRELGVASAIDIGMTVGDSIHFTRSIHLPADLLAAMAHEGIDLEVSAYPTSDGCPEGPPELAPARSGPPLTRPGARRSGRNLRR